MQPGGKKTVKSRWSHCHLASGSHFGWCVYILWALHFGIEFLKWCKSKVQFEEHLSLSIPGSTMTWLTKRQDRSGCILPNTMADSFQLFTLGSSNSPNYMCIQRKWSWGYKANQKTLQIQSYLVIVPFSPSSLWPSNSGHCYISQEKYPNMTPKILRKTWMIGWLHSSVSGTHRGKKSKKVLAFSFKPSDFNHGILAFPSKQGCLQEYWVWSTLGMECFFFSLEL